MAEDNGGGNNPIIDLYKSMLSSSDPEVRSYAKKTGYKEFSTKLVNDKDYRDEIYYGLSQKGLTDLQPSTWESTLGLRSRNAQIEYLGGGGERREAESARKEIDMSELEPVKEMGMFDSALDFGKTIINSVIFYR